MGIGFQAVHTLDHSCFHSGLCLGHKRLRIQADLSLDHIWFQVGHSKIIQDNLNVLKGAVRGPGCDPPGR